MTPSAFLVALSTTAFTFLSIPVILAAEEAHDHRATPGHEAHDDADTHPEPLGFSLSGGWTDPWVHSHFSPRGTPLVHLFGLEPAFLDRDLFFDFAVTAADGEDGSELEVELEYALTRRLGIVAEVPLVLLNPEDGQTETGVGDAAIAPRALLIDTDRFLLSANLEVTFPIGSESRGLGGGEVALAPSVSTWLDLGHWVTLSAQFGTEHGLQTGDSELFYAAALTYSFPGPALFPGHGDDHAGHAAHSHFPPGLTSLIAEYTGRTALSGDDADRSTGEVLFGLSHVLTESFEVRGAYQLPLGGTRDIDYGYVLSVIYHF